MIAPNVVLSAAHCNDPYDASNVASGYVGATHFWSTDDGAVLGVCEEWINHPEFVTGEFNPDGSIVDGTTSLGGYDFALCRLSEPVTIDESEVYLVLNDNPKVPRGRPRAESMGMGRTSRDMTESTDRLRTTEVRVYRTTLCDDYYQNTDIDGETMLCTFNSKDPAGSRSGVCTGDSGGPVILNKKSGDGREKHVQIGLVSFGTSTCTDFPDVHARVSRGFDWIKTTVCVNWSATLTGTPTFCDPPLSPPPCGEDVDGTFTMTTDEGEVYPDSTCELIADFLAPKVPGIVDRVCGFPAGTAGHVVSDLCTQTCGTLGSLGVPDCR